MGSTHRRMARVPERPANVESESRVNGEPARGIVCIGALARLWATLLGPWLVLVRHRQLILQLLKQEIRDTYARTVLGLYWIALLPVFYVLVFIGVRFVALDQGVRQWLPEGGTPNPTLWQAFAIVVGLIVFWLAIEVMTRSPKGVRKHAALVTDLKFPVEVLPWVVVGLAMFNFAVRFALMVGAFFLLIGIPHWEMVISPLAVVPMAVLLVGVTFLFASVGVFISDLEFLVQVLMTALLLLSGILFPLAMVPEPYQSWLYLNPIAFAVREVRHLGLFGQGADWIGLWWTFFAGVLATGCGYKVFRCLRPRFSDAL